MHLCTKETQRQRWWLQNQLYLSRLPADVKSLKQPATVIFAFCLFCCGSRLIVHFIFLNIKPSPGTTLKRTGSDGNMLLKVNEKFDYERLKLDFRLKEADNRFLQEELENKDRMLAMLTEGLKEVRAFFVLCCNVVFAYFTPRIIFCAIYSSSGRAVPDTVAHREPRLVLRAGESSVPEQTIKSGDGEAEGAGDDAGAGEAAPTHPQPHSPASLQPLEAQPRYQAALNEIATQYGNERLLALRREAGKFANMVATTQAKTGSMKVYRCCMFCKKRHNQVMLMFVICEMFVCLLILSAHFFT